MNYIGCSGLKRAISRAMTHVYDFTYERETGLWSLATHLILIGDKINTFRMGEEKDYVTMDGRKAKVNKVFYSNKIFK